MTAESPGPAASGKAPFLLPGSEDCSEDCYLPGSLAASEGAQYSVGCAERTDAATQARAGSVSLLLSRSR